MAVTGFIGVGYVVGHVFGNLQAFRGPSRLNDYAAFLRSTGALLWTVRVVLLGAVLLHIVAAYQLARLSLKGREVGYYRWQPVASTYGSRTMRWTGPIIGLFILYHLLHLTIGIVHPDFQQGNVYANVVTGFRVWYVSAFYIVAMLALGFHLYHGVWSMFQSLGINHPKYNRLIRGVAIFFTIIVVSGFIAIPVGVLSGIIS
jgi:succinate dehydrogenase / fumarate reductase cytochrome b subunit